MKTQKTVQSEYQEFLAQASQLPPAKVSRQLSEKIHTELYPTATHLLKKLGAIHLLGGGLSLLFCPQFGFGFSPEWGPMSLFMSFGELGCKLGCGITYFLLTGILTAHLLTLDEVRTIRTKLWLMVGLFALLSLGLFVCLGASLLLPAALTWALGSLLGGEFGFELAVRLRSWAGRRAF